MADEKFDFTDVVEKPSGEKFDFSDVVEKKNPNQSVSPSPSSDTNSPSPSPRIKSPVTDALRQNIKDTFEGSQIYQNPKTRDSYYSALDKLGVDKEEAQRYGEDLFQQKNDANAPEMPEGVEAPKGQMPMQNKMAWNLVEQGKNIVNGIKEGIQNNVLPSGIGGSIAAQWYKDAEEGKPNSLGEATKSLVDAANYSIEAVKGIDKAYSTSNVQTNDYAKLIAAPIDAAFGILGATPVGLAFYSGMDALKAAGIPADKLFQLGSEYEKSVKDFAAKNGIQTNESDLHKTITHLADNLGGAMLMHVAGASAKIADKMKLGEPLTPKEKTVAADAISKIDENSLKAAAAHPDNPAAAATQKDILDLADDQKKDVPDDIKQNIQNDIEQKTGEMQQHVAEKAQADNIAAHKQALDEHISNLEKILPTLSDAGKESTNKVITELRQQSDAIKIPSMPDGGVEAPEQPINENKDETKNQKADVSISIGKSEATTVDEAPRDSKEVGKGISEPKESTDAQGTPSSDASVPEKQEKVTPSLKEGGKEKVSKVEVGEEKKGKAEADKIATDNNFDNSTHLINSANKRLGTDYKTVQEISADEIKKVKQEREGEKGNLSVVRETMYDPINRETNSKPFTILDKKSDDVLRTHPETGEVGLYGKKLRFKTHAQAEKALKKYEDNLKPSLSEIKSEPPKEKSEVKTPLEDKIDRGNELKEKVRTAKEKAQERLDKAREAFRKAQGLSSGGLESLPEFIELVKAHINYGIESIKEFIKDYRALQPDSKKSDAEIEEAFNKVKEEEGVKATSTKNAVVNAERLAEGKEPITKIKAIDLAAIKEKVKEHLNNPDVYLSNDKDVNPRLLAQWSSDNPHAPITAWQEALLGGDRDRLNATRELANNEAEKAKVEGDMAKYASQRELYLDADRLLNINAKANSYRGTQWSDIGRQRQQSIKEDYSADALLNKYRVANNFEDIPEHIEKQLRSQSKKIDELEKQLAEQKKKTGDAEAQKARDFTVKKITDEIDKERGKATRSIRIKKARNLQAEGVADLADALGITKKAIGDVKPSAIGAIKKIAKGLSDEFGIYGDDLIKKLKEFISEKLGDQSAFIDKNKKDILDYDNVLEKLKEKQVGGEPLPQKELIDMARQLVREGVRDPKEIVTAIHQQIKEVLPDVTPREIQDAMSGYGKVKFPNSDEIETQIRDIKAQLQTLSKIEDASKGERPLKSGLQRDKPTAEQRLLNKELERVMRRNKIEDTPADREKKLQTALDARRTKLENDIEEIDSQLKKISEGEHIKPLTTKEPLPLDNESKELKLQRDEKKKELDRLINEGLTDEEKHQIAEDERAAKIKTVQNTLTTRLEKLVEQNKTGDYTKPQKAEPVNSPEIERLKNRIVDEKKIADRVIRERYLKDRVWFKKAFDFLSDYQHLAVITSPRAIAKIATNIPVQMLRNSIHDVFSTALGIIPQLRNAPTFRDNATANMKALSKRWATITNADTWKDSWNAFLGRTTDIERMKGEDKEDANPYWKKQFDWLRKFLYSSGVGIHKGLKNPVMKSEYEAELIKWNTMSQLSGEDITDPTIIERNKNIALAKGLSVAFMQDNAVVNKWRLAISDAGEKKQSAGKEFAVELGKFGLKTLNPVVKLPANYARDMFELETGLIQAVGQGLHQMLPESFAGKGEGGGWAKMSAEDKNKIIKRILKGSAGAALTMYAWKHAGNFGGYYQTKHDRDLLDKNPEEAEKQGILPLGSIKIGKKIFGENIVAKLLLHNPIYAVMQIAATGKKVYDAKHKEGTDVGAMAMGKATAGVVGEIPFLENTKRTMDAVETNPKKALANYGKSFVPAFAKTIWEWTHPKEEKPKPVSEDEKIEQTDMKEEPLEKSEELTTAH